MGSIRCGILFIMAWWSGPARVAWEEMKKLLAEIDPGLRLEVVVVDIDGMIGFEATQLGATIGGVGETTWIWDGLPLLNRWRTLEFYREYTEQLRNLCQSCESLARE
jgi:hypothetical protein